MNLEAEIKHAANTGLVHQQLLSQRTKIFPILARFLRTEVNMNELEKYEWVWKAVLREMLREPVTGQTARALARFQKKIGFLLKYKSYTIKASSPLGYSIFFQNNDEGFSFQQHVNHKVEIFHILHISPRAFIFTCDLSEWQQVFRKTAFRRWLAGEPDPDYDQFVYRPTPGDVLVIDRLNVVHSVFGCFLEEFATVSTDMVDRLFDQNEFKSIPTHFNRRYANALLKIPRPPEINRRVQRTAGGLWGVENIVPVVFNGWTETVLATVGSLLASRLFLSANQSTGFIRDDIRTTSLFIAQGSGSVTIADSEEIQRTLPSPIMLSIGDIIMIPKGIYYQIGNVGNSPLVITRHQIPLDLSLKEK